MTSAEVEYIFQKATEGEVVERSISSLLSACIEGVSASLLCGGSSKTSHTNFCEGAFHPKSEHNGLINTILEHLYATLLEKEAALNVSRKNQFTEEDSEKKSYEFHVTMSYVEIYEEVITVRIVF